MDESDGAPETTGTNARATEVWDQVVADMAATADELEGEGWTTLQLHPGDVTLLTDAEDRGIDVVLPNPEFEDLESLVESGARFAEYDVYRAGGAEMGYALVVAKDPGTETAVLVPLYYRVQELRPIAGMEETMPIFLRVLTEETIRLDLADPDLLLPED